MAEYIEREAAIEKLNRLCDRVCQYSKAQRKYMCGACPLGDAFTVIEDDISAADVRPVVKSKWADNRVAFYRGCPECGAFVRANLDEVFLRDFPSAVGRLNYCPNCGADMREES